MNRAKGQNNLAKIASSVSRTPHARDRLALAVSRKGLRKGSQKLKVSHVTPARTPIWPTFAQIWIGFAAIYTHAKFQKLQLFRKYAAEGLKTQKSRDPAPDPI